MSDSLYKPDTRTLGIGLNALGRGYSTLGIGLSALRYGLSVLLCAFENDNCLFFLP